MPGIKKYEGITGLNTGHALYSKIDRFVVFGDTITDIKSGTVYTSTSAVVDDDLIGKGRSFTSNANIVSPTVPVYANCTVLLIYRHTGANTGGSTSDSILFQRSSGDSFALQAGSWSAYDYRVTRRGSYGTSYSTDYKPYAGVVSEKQKIHAMALDYFSGTSSLYLNGNALSIYGGTANTTFTPSTNPIAVTLAPVVGTTGSFIMTGFVIFNAQLTDAEKASVTTNPWDLTNGTTPLVASIDIALTPGALITATLVNYPVDPTTVTITDSRGNSIVRSLTSIGNNQHTFTVPNLATDAVGIPYILTGSVNLSFGARTIVSNFGIPTPNESVTLVSPVATEIFEGWGPDTPVAGEQLISQGNFDFNGNFTANAVDTQYNCWITKLDGSNHFFTVQLSTATVPVSIETNNQTLDITYGNGNVKAGVSIAANNVTIPVNLRRGSVVTASPVKNPIVGNSPKWSAFKGVSKYYTLNVVMPTIPVVGVHAVTIGPYDIGDSRGRLDVRHWLVNQTNGVVVIRYSKS